MASNINVSFENKKEMGALGGVAPMVSDAGGVIEEDQDRAVIYNLLSRVLAAPVTDETFELLRGFAEVSEKSGIGEALYEIGLVARKTPRNSGEEEFSALFHGMGSGGEIQPYMSYYLTGFVYEKPLATLRDDLRELGVVASGLSKEPEDHMAFICEVMAGLIMGSSNNSRPLQQQKLFFTRHLAPWAHRFFVDLESAKASELYKPIGSLGRVFMRIEADAFEMIGD